MRAPMEAPSLITRNVDDNRLTVDTVAWSPVDHKPLIQHESIDEEVTATER
jgi:hypothetical protein